jgi:hypothetical protein
LFVPFIWVLHERTKGVRYAITSILLQIKCSAGSAIHRDVDRKMSDRNRVVRIESTTPPIADERKEKNHQAEKEEKPWITRHAPSEEARFSSRTPAQIVSRVTKRVTGDGRRCFAARHSIHFGS